MINKKLMITGGSGKLAGCLKNYLSTENKMPYLSPSKEELDISNFEETSLYFKEHSFTHIIHAAAFTKPMAAHARYPEKSIRTNIIGTSNLAILCKQFNVKMVYISTDYVYPGTKGNYNESEALGPYSASNDGISKYGWSKLGGECAVRILDDYLILRACLCDFPFPHEYALIDVKKSLIYHHDAAPLIIQCLDQSGIVNLGGRSNSVYEFAKTNNPNVKQISRNSIKDVTIAPDTSMDTSKLEHIIRVSSP